MSRLEDLEVVKKGLDRHVADFDSIEMARKRLQIERDVGNISQASFKEEYEKAVNRTIEVTKMVGQDQELYNKIDKGHSLTIDQSNHLTLCRRLYVER